MSWIIGVDVGGTFTDLCARNNNTGETVIHKRPSTPSDPAIAILNGIDEIKLKINDNKLKILRLAHGTTVATNALLQRKGGKLVLITTKGFRDLLEIGRQVRPSVYDLQIDSPPPLVERSHRFEVDERVDFKGRIIKNLFHKDITSLEKNIKKLKNIDGIAICLLFSFLNTENEIKLKKILSIKFPNLPISISSEVQPEFREYERFSTTTINAYLQPEVGKYMDNLKEGIIKKDPNIEVNIFQSSGGLTTISKASNFPVRMALSGPAAGVVGASEITKKSKFKDIITLDMGGTSTDVCLIQNGKAELSNLRDISGFRIRLPMIDINTVGAGGGSIAYVESDGLLKVGPISAGALPGPACYNLGGIKPTVSDANLILGRLPETLVGGEMKLNKKKCIKFN
jgi:N-methylhydantoinase A